MGSSLKSNPPGRARRPLPFRCLSLDKPTHINHSDKHRAATVFQEFRARYCGRFSQTPPKAEPDGGGHLLDFRKASPSLVASAAVPQETKPSGLSICLSWLPNQSYRFFTSRLMTVGSRSHSVALNSRLLELLPNKRHFITRDGSAIGRRSYARPMPLPASTALLRGSTRLGE
jgi:hypothetical protein